LGEYYGIPFYYLPVTAEIKPKVEIEQLELVARHSVDLIVLARYMQVFSAGFVSEMSAFTGANPYHGSVCPRVKLIGSTTHYVTDILVEGPIIELDVTRISHRDQLEDLIQKGRDLERVVLSRAVRWHLDHRILCYANKTVVFD